ncbi:xanthine dehydrogenase small subunit [Cupriavidus gilardii CR3]|nr:xanthine dehydrogenase small subunit [Cupriavidus gilardii CR3]
METQPIRFYHRGQVQQVTDAPITRTVLQYLREDARCTGTKEGCAEGDCGACTVVIGELQQDGELSFKAVNSCIQFLPTLDGKALITVEDLRQADGSLHPVQEAMVECHGSQCGFCTPGFVMSLWALYQQHQPGGPAPDRQTICDALTGNLCRCTGYRPIIEAGQRMMSLPAPHASRLEPKAIASALRTLMREDTFHYRDPSGALFHAPRTASAFAALKAAEPSARILAGSTDVGLWVTKQFRELGNLLYVGQVEDLQHVVEHDGVIEIGAAVSLERAYAALNQAHPELEELWKRFASLPIRNAGTLGGNIANGSPIGDSMPALIALGPRSCCSIATRAARCRSRTCTWPTRRPRWPRANSSRRCGCRCPGPSTSVPTSCPNGLTRTSRRSAPPSASPSPTAWCARPASPSAAWRPRPSARPTPRSRCSASAGTKPPSRPRWPRCRRTTRR